MQQGPYPELVIGVQCPKGHDMYPKGVRAKTLWNNNGIRFADRQQVVPTLSHREYVFMTQTAWRSGDVIPKDGHPEHYNNGCYRLTEEQYAFLNRKCNECE